VTSLLLIDLFALLAMAAGGTMMLRQHLVRRLWSRLRGSGAGDPMAPEREEAARYALTIFGMMLFAFGLIIFGFFTTFALVR
jgi:hypothetical protein